MVIVLATLCYAFSVNILKHRLHEVPAVSISGFALMFVGPPLGIFLLTTDFIERLSHADGAWLNLGYVTILAVFGTAISIVLFNMLLKISGAVYSSSVTYLIPVVAMLWGIFDNEKLGILHLLAFAVIMLGVYLINRSESRAME
jgi:drug/metabolite transporter (DMT)-like permease